MRVARAMRAPGFQPTLHKICTGRVASPKRSSAERIAKHFGIPVDAVYDDALATQLYEDMRGGSPVRPADPANTPARMERQAGSASPERSTRDVLEALAQLLEGVPSIPRRSAIASLLASFAHEAGAPEYVDILTVALRPSVTPGHARRRDGLGDRPMAAAQRFLAAEGQDFDPPARHVKDVPRPS